MKKKWCVVPQCTSTSTKTPEKLFISIPKDAKIRRKWLQLARRNPDDIVGSSNVFMCEDHFEMKKVITNYTQFKMGFSQRLLVAQSAMPSKFHCQQERRKRLYEASTSIPAHAKGQKAELIQECVEETQSTPDYSSNQTKYNDIQDVPLAHSPLMLDITAMETDKKVFSSNISRLDYKEHTSLYDLIHITPAKPALQKRDERINCKFIPKSEKQYIPKKRSKLKVRTVRDIRSIFEQDTFSYLTKDLEKQKDILLRKIKDGSSATDCTKALAKKILEDNEPISRTVWQMVNNINPEGHLNAKQFVLWNGKSIQVNGSKGGKAKFICNHDLCTSKNLKYKNKYTFKKKKFINRKGLLKNSLTVKFKPGPLSCKKSLDDSHQKYIGNIEIVNLPKPALDVQPAYGTVLNSTISRFLNNLRPKDGLISQKWSEFAVSVVGTSKNNTPIQNDTECCVTFDLNYKCEKTRILMRRDKGDVKQYCGDIDHTTESQDTYVNNNDTQVEIKDIIDNLLNAVEISLIQNDLYSKSDEVIETEMYTGSNMEIDNYKEKTRKKYSELDRLDVTVIKLPGDSQNSVEKKCDKPHCNFGCICDSLVCSYNNLSQHCGNFDCMFECKCELFKYKNIELLQDSKKEVLPELINLDRKLTSRLAKEEQKFHQTLILSGEQSILLKPQKRNRKPLKRFCELDDTNFVKNSKKLKFLTITERKLNCQNIEPWCMVHSLYRCFCKGKITDSSVPVVEVSSVDNNKPIEHIIDVTTVNNNSTDQINTKEDNYRLRTRQRISLNLKETNNSSDINLTTDNTCDSFEDVIIASCSRTDGYEGRKYSDGYYKTTNNKILEMEKNDILLQKRMLKIMNSSEDSDSISHIESNPASTVTSPDKCFSKTNDMFEVFSEGQETQNKNKLVTWIETSYKIYKERLDRGIKKKSLDAPKKGKMALHPWDFILTRYRERKNLFLVSKQKPFRLFLAINDDNSFFDKCINIDDIHFADLNNYPTIIKNLLTNATDLKDNFCILGGWENCWELIGSVTKLSGQEQSPSNQLFDTDKFMSQPSSLNEKDGDVDFDKFEDFTSDNSNIDRNELLNQDTTERSKWFLMILENDFKEIQFYKKGFYVRYDSIVQAIELAWISGKTVRLSSQLCNDKNSGPQFGVYAIPKSNQFSVYVGPYEIDEPLGLETIRTILDTRKCKRTRGVWIITNKVDNMKVINNPLSFMPSTKEQSEIMLTIGSNYNFKNTIKRHQPLEAAEEMEIKEQLSQSIERVENREQPSILQGIETVQNKEEDVSEGNLPSCKPKVKPIKIRKTNGFYHLSPKKNLSSNTSEPSPIFKTLNLNKRSLLIRQNRLSIMSDLTKKSNLKTVIEKSVTETTPKKTITEICSQNNSDKTSEENKSTGKKLGMFILKPEEINKKLESQYPQTSKPLEELKNNDDETDEDLENVLSSSLIATDEIVLSSDDEDKCQDIWIQCTNIEHLGWIKGKRNGDQEISFTFPGFNQSLFYAEHVALNKINEVLSRKVPRVPRNIEAKWKVVDSRAELKGNMLTTANLKKNYVLTQKGLIDKKELLALHMLKTYSKRLNINAPSTSKMNEVEETYEMIEELEEESNTLERETDDLWRETVANEAEILHELRVPPARAPALSRSLQSIIDLNDDDDDEDS